MKTYIGTKVVKAEPQQKNIGLKWEDGYKVVYEDGYVSWSPKDTFEKAYKEVSEDEAFAQEKSVGFWGGFASRRGQERNEAIQLLRKILNEDELHEQLTTSLLEEIRQFSNKFPNVQ